MANDIRTLILFGGMLREQGEEARKQRERTEHELEAMIRKAKARNR